MFSTSAVETLEGQASCLPNVQSLICYKNSALLLLAGKMPALLVQIKQILCIYC